MQFLAAIVVAQILAFVVGVSAAPLVTPHTPLSPTSTWRNVQLRDQLTHKKHEKEIAQYYEHHHPQGNHPQGNHPQGNHPQGKPHHQGDGKL